MITRVQNETRKPTAGEIDFAMMRLRAVARSNKYQTAEYSSLDAATMAAAKRLIQAGEAKAVMPSGLHAFRDAIRLTEAK